MTRRERWDEWLDGLQDRYGQKRVVTLAFIASWIGVVRSERKSSTYATAIPLLIAFLSIEGTSYVTLIGSDLVFPAGSTVRNASDGEASDRGGNYP